MLVSRSMSLTELSRGIGSSMPTTRPSLYVIKPLRGDKTLIKAGCATPARSVLSATQSTADGVVSSDLELMDRYAKDQV